MAAGIVTLDLADDAARSAARLYALLIRHRDPARAAAVLAACRAAAPHRDIEKGDAA